MRYSIFILLISLGLTVFTGCSTDEKDDVSASIEVSGIVTSDLGQPLEAVLIKSSQDSTFTGKKGEYTVRAYPRGALEFYKAGYVKHIEPVEEQREINVTLKRILDGSATRYDARQIRLSCGEDTAAVAILVEVMDFGQGVGTMTWTKNKVWVLKNSVFVNAGQTLTIEPGTIVKGAVGSPDSTGSLIVAKGGFLIANGTDELPIIFTAESDSILRDTSGQLCRGTNLTRSDQGLWGGLILCGSAPVDGGRDSLRLPGFPEIETRNHYGGQKGIDNSGILRYLSIRHGGKFFPGATLAGGGSGTTFEHIEIYACQSESFRFSGGMVNTRHLVAAFGGGAAFQVEKGWQGRNQFWLAAENGGAALSGGSGPSVDSLPGPTFVNAAFVGPEGGATPAAAAIRGAVSGAFYNSIFVKYDAGMTVKLPGSVVKDSTELLLQRIPVFKNCQLDGDAFFTLGEAHPAENDAPEAQEALQVLNDRFQDESNGNLTTAVLLDKSFIPVESSPVKSGFIPAEQFFEITDYRGCFPPGKPAWTTGWTRLKGE